MSVQPSRVADLFTEWSRLKASTEQSEVSLFTDSEDLLASDSIAVIVGTNPVNNLRTLGLAQYVFPTAAKPENIAVLFTCPSKDCTIAECSVTVYTAGAAITPAAPAAEGAPPQPIINILSGEDQSAFIAALTAAGSDGKKIVYSERDVGPDAGGGGAFAAPLIAALKAVGHVDGHPMLGSLLYTKDKEAVQAVRKASAVTLAALFKNWLIPEVSAQASSVSKSKCSRLAQQCEDKLNAPNTIPGFESMADFSSFGSWVSASILPQGHFNDSIATAVSPSIELPTSSIVVRVCPRYREQYGYVARTLFFDTESLPKNAEEAYNFALEVQATVAANIQEGKSVKAVFEETMAFATTLNATYAASLSPEFGFLTGPVVMEKRTRLSADGQVVIRAGMTFVVRIVMKNVKIGDSDNTFDIEVADTIFIGEPIVKKAFRAFKEVLLAVDGELGTNGGGGSVRIQTRAGKTGVVQVGEEDRLREMQKKIWELKASTHAGKGASVVDDTDLLFAAGRLAHGTLQSYTAPSAIPTEITNRKQATVWIDKARSTAWLPMDETHMAPFHLSIINKVDVKAEGASGFSLTVSFATTQETNIPFRQNRNKVFVKELSYQSDKSQEFDLFCRTFNDVKKAIKDDDARRKLEQGAIPVTGRGIRGHQDAPLRDVEFRPAPVTGRGRCRGNFEACDNGFVFRMLGTTVEILYENVKLAVCQPCKNDTHTIFHLLLHRPILLGRRSTTDVQVVAEVLESSESVNAGRGMKYAQELEAEARDRQRVDATNRQFLLFAADVKTKLGKDRVAVPKDSVDFEGNFGKGSVRFRGSNQGLWAVSEMPFFSLRLEDFEVAVLERVIVGGGNFDIAFIPHNYKAPVNVSNISMAEVISIKSWLCGANMPFFETTINLNYTQLFKTIRVDEGWEPFSENGWRTCVEDSDGDEEDEEDSSWHESDEEDDSSAVSDESGSDWDTESSSAATESSGSAVSWDEMERRAEESDESEVSSEDSRPAKKKGARVETRPRR